MKAVKHYEIMQGSKTLRLETFHELQGIVQALRLQGKKYKAFTVFTDGTREPIYNLMIGTYIIQGIIYALFI